jgi:putative transposase
MSTGDREVGRRHVATLMGMQALYRKPNTSRKHPVFPYALRNLAIERANQVWALDITYIPIARGWVYLVAGTSANSTDSRVKA